MKAPFLKECSFSVFQRKRKSKQKSRMSSDILSRLPYLHVSPFLWGKLFRHHTVGLTDVDWISLTGTVHGYISLLGGNEDISRGEAPLW